MYIWKQMREPNIQSDANIEKICINNEQETCHLENFCGYKHIEKNVGIITMDTENPEN